MLYFQPMIGHRTRFAKFAFGTLAGGALAIVAASNIHAETAGEEQDKSSARQEMAANSALPRFTAVKRPKVKDSFAPFEAGRQDKSARLTIPDHAVDIASFEPKRQDVRKPKVDTSKARSLGTGVASYYGKRFHGRLTANGERFDMNAMTAAHKTLPFGTRLRITNKANGKSVIVRINDRGPYIRGREIDLSRKAAERIGLIHRGHGTVKIEKL